MALRVFVEETIIRTTEGKCLTLPLISYDVLAMALANLIATASAYDTRLYARELTRRGAAWAIIIEVNKLVRINAPALHIFRSASPWV